MLKELNSFISIKCLINKMNSEGYKKAKECFEKGKIIKYVSEIKSPTLLDLVDFMEKYKNKIEVKNILKILIKDFEELDFEIVKEHYMFYKKSGKYYIHGQLKMSINELLTEKMMIKAKQEFYKRRCMYQPCNSNEAQSIQKCIINFNEFNRIIEAYFVLQNHVMYKPI